MNAPTESQRSIKEVLEAIFNQHRELVQQNKDLRARLTVAEPVYLAQQARQHGRRLTRHIRLSVSDLALRAMLLARASEQGHLVTRPNWLELRALRNHTLTLDATVAIFTARLKAAGLPTTLTETPMADRTADTPLARPVEPNNDQSAEGSVETTGQDTPDVTETSQAEALPESEEQALVDALIHELMDPAGKDAAPLSAADVRALATFLPLSLEDFGGEKGLQVEGESEGDTDDEPAEPTRPQPGSEVATSGLVKTPPVDRRERREQQRLARRQAKQQARASYRQSSP